MKVNRERARVWREVTSVYLEYSSLDSAIAELQKYRDQYGANTRIQKHDYAYEDGYYYAIMQERDETDAEMSKRIAQEERWAGEQAARERAEFERLKAKFGG